VLNGGRPRPCAARGQLSKCWWKQQGDLASPPAASDHGSSDHGLSVGFLLVWKGLAFL